MAGGTEGEDALLRAALLLVTPGPAEGGVKTVQVERLLQPLGLPHIGMKRAVVEWIDAARQRLRIAVHDQVHPCLRRGPVAQFVHGAELPRRVDMQQRKGWPGREERFAREV